MAARSSDAEKPLLPGRRGPARPPVAWHDSAFLGAALLFVAVASYVLLDRLSEDELLVLGVPVLLGAAALVNLVKAWRLWRIRGWIAGKPQMKGQLGDIVGSVARMHGITTEQKALSRLRLPRGWTALPNVPYGHGDIDLVLVGPDGTAYSVEIKSWSGLFRRRTMLGLGSVVLVKKNGREPDTDPIEQTLREARALAGLRRYPRVVPILWLPNGHGWTYQHRGVKVINGGAGKLKRAVGAGWLSW